MAKRRPTKRMSRTLDMPIKEALAFVREKLKQLPAPYPAPAGQVWVTREDRHADGRITVSVGLEPAPPGVDA
jgi:hypothetical protein